jgi:formiminoglutamate deiminase
VTEAGSGRYWCELALVDGVVRPGVAIEIDGGRFSSVEAGTVPNGGHRLEGFTIPGMANAHSHAFHRALRSRTQSGPGTFWTWRELMYRAAARLEPDTYFRLARATFAEMALAGITCVGEFHYLHHTADGTPYADPNEMGGALLAAADEAGIRVTLLDTLYLHGGLDPGGYREPDATQRRFADRTADAWVQRVDRLRPAPTQRIGAAIHSVRAVDPGAMRTVADWAASVDAPIHAHVSEQVAENDHCVAHHGRTPIGVFDDAGALSGRFTAVHATHLAEGDIVTLAVTGSTVAMCPTTERDLGDGIGPTDRFRSQRIAMAIGSDSHAVIDLLEEARALELDERLRSQQRGVHAAADLVSIATLNGHRSLGWDDAGAISVGLRADLVSLSLTSVRTAGASAANAVETAIFAATAADVTDVIVDGHHVVADRRHVGIDVAAELAASIGELMDP